MTTNDKIVSTNIMTASRENNNNENDSSIMVDLNFDLTDEEYANVDFTSMQEYYRKIHDRNNKRKLICIAISILTAIVTVILLIIYPFIDRPHSE